MENYKFNVNRYVLYKYRYVDQKSTHSNKNFICNLQISSIDQPHID